MHDDHSNVSPTDASSVRGESYNPSTPQGRRNLQIGFAWQHRSLQVGDEPGMLRPGSVVQIIAFTIMEEFLTARRSHHSDGSVFFTSIESAENAALNRLQHLQMSPEALALARKRVRQALKYGSEKLQQSL